MKIALVFLIAAALASAQRITTIQLDGVQYFVSRMNPYSPELNYFLAYQYCRSLGLQLASFETKEKADTMSQYLKNAGYTKFDFWTSGNKLGTDMFLWMSTGLPFNATFDYMRKLPGHSETDVPPGTEPQRVARESGESGNADGCVAMKAPTLEWEAEDCTLYKDFICEQTRCYYYNYGSIPVSATQGTRRPYVTSTTARPVVENDHPHNHHHHQQPEHTHEEGEGEGEAEGEVEVEEDISGDHDSTAENNDSNEKIATPQVSEDPIVNRLVTAIPTTSETLSAETVPADATADEALPAEAADVAVEGEGEEVEEKDEGEPLEQRTLPDHGIPDIASLFTPRKDSVFDGLETREVRRPLSKTEDVPAVDYENVETELPNNALEDARTIGPYDGTQQDYVNDQPAQDEPSAALKDEDSSTILPEAEPAYRYNIKVRSNGKVLDPPSK